MSGCCRRANACGGQVVKLGGSVSGNVCYSLLLKARCTQSSSMGEVMHGEGVKEKVMCSGVYGRSKGKC